MRFGRQWEGFPWYNQQHPLKKDVAPEKTPEGDWVIYHSTSPEGAKSIVDNRRIEPDDIDSVGFGARPEHVWVYGQMKAGPRARMVRAVVDKDWFSGQQVSHEIGGSGHSQYLFRKTTGVPPEAIKDIHDLGEHP